MKTIDLNLPASPASPTSSATSGSDAADRTDTSAHAESSTAAQTRRAGGPLAALANLHDARLGAIRRTVSGSPEADGSERPAKRLRRTLSDGSTPVAPWRNESAMHVFRWSMIRRQPMARFLRSGPVAEIANHLPHESQRNLFDALLCTPEERYGYLKLMRPEAAGQYLLQADDPAVLGHALSRTGIETLHGVPLPDVVVDRAGWLLRAGTAAAARADDISEHALDAMDRAEALLLGGFDEAGPSARAGAVRNLTETSACANTLEDVFRFALQALAPERFRALPLNERAHALATIARSISRAGSLSWLDADDLSDDDDRLEREAEIQGLLSDGLAAVVPMMLDEARRLCPIPSDAVHLLVTSLISTLQQVVPQLDTQRAILDLFEAQMPYLQGADRDATLGRLAESLSLFERPVEQWRVLNMVEHRRPGAAPAEDRLAHVGTDGRSRILLGMLDSLRRGLQDENLRGQLLNLLANQLAPDRARELPIYSLQHLLVRMVEFDPGAHDAERMLTIALDALDALSGVYLLGPLQAMARRVDEPLGEALTERMREARLRLIPRLPLEFMPAEASLLDALSPEDEARVLAARMNEAEDVGRHQRQLIFSMVAGRLAARAAGTADARQVTERMARALPPHAAAVWADQLETHLSDVRPAPEPTVDYSPVLEMLHALRAQRR